MFDQAFVAADEASLSLMGEDVTIASGGGSSQTRAVRDEGEYFSTLGDGGFVGTRNCTFYLLSTEATRTMAGPGSRVITAKDEWQVSTIRDMGTMTALICISTSGQAAPEF